MSSVHRKQFLCVCVCMEELARPLPWAPQQLQPLCLIAGHCCCSWQFRISPEALQKLKCARIWAAPRNCVSELVLHLCLPHCNSLTCRMSLLLNSRPSLSRNIHLFLRERWHVGCPGHPAELQSEAPAGPGCAPGAPQALSVGKGLVESEPQLWACARA